MDSSAVESDGRVRALEATPIRSSRLSAGPLGPAVGRLRLPIARAYLIEMASPGGMGPEPAPVASFRP